MAVNQIYAAYCGKLNSNRTNDLALWSGMYKMLSLNVPLIDRANHVIMPYNLTTYPRCALPKDLSNFDLTYEQCCEHRVAGIVELSRRLNKPITIFYSGGIDSTMVLISFMKYLSPQELKSRVQVSMSVDSIYENKNFYHDYIRKMCNIVPSEQMSNIVDGSSILVDGELNDQLFGSEIIGNMYRKDFFSGIGEKYSREFIVNWYVFNNITKESANKWFDVIDDHIKIQAPCEVKTNYQFFWWWNFIFKWQSVYLRIFLRMDTNLRPLVNHEFIDTYVHHFYSTPEFQKWSMLNHHLKLQDSWKTYKWEAKRLIYEYNKDTVYRDNKVKVGSLYHLYGQKKAAECMTTNFKFIDLDDFDPTVFYNPNNNFI
jgi:hypothetical protein